MSARLRILIPTSCVGVIGVLLFLSGVVLAHHSKFMGMHIQVTKNADRADLPENHMSVVWALTPNGKVKYFVDTPGPHDATPHVTSIVPLVETSVAKWENALVVEKKSASANNETPKIWVPVLNWERVYKAGDADVRVIYMADCGVHKGYFLVPEVFDFEYTPTPGLPEPGWHSDLTRKANYWQYGDLCIDSSATILSDTDAIRDESLLSIISHEIGHAYGLAEVYYDGKNTTPTPTGTPDACKDNDTESIMDTFRRMDVPTTTPVPFHCDGLTGPSERDKKLVKEAFAQGGIAHLKPDNTGNYVTFKWTDNAWGEFEHEVRFYYYNGERHDSKPQKNWVEIRGQRKTYRDNIGGHMTMPTPIVTPMIKDETVSMTKHQKDNQGIILPQYTYYIACGHVSFLQINAFGPWTCSSTVRVDNSDHNSKITPSPTPTATATLAPTATAIPTPIPSGDLTAPSTSMPVAGALEVTVANLQPNDHAKFTLNLTGPIVKRDPSKDELGCEDRRRLGGNDWVQTVDSAAKTDIYACRAGDGHVALNLKDPVSNIANLSIAVVAPTPSPTSTPSPTATPTGPYLVASKTYVRVNRSFSVTAHNVHVSGARLIPTLSLGDRRRL